jgi:hypothetical protein
VILGLPRRTARGSNDELSRLLGFVANRFDVVPVRTDDEGRVVVRVVVRAQARRTVALATRLESRTIERIDLLAILGSERQVSGTGFSSVWYRHNEADFFE